ncbi:MAG: 16S rRNA (cytosine(1402)-N(4))-methyltransferase RsmH [Candidatus Paceibacterota bacterium]|jgi:16S rRNA (cytosine1402-N4)-methyltransferase
MIHTSVLLKESLGILDIQAGDVFLDCTLGNGGHSLAVCNSFGDTVQTVALDLDADAIARSWARLEQEGCKKSVFIQESFRNLDIALDKAGHPTADKILFDLGLSSNQLEESMRGFSFQKNEPLVMTFKKDPTPEDMTASDVVNSWEEEHIKDILFGFGEEQYARRIARAIVEARKIKRIDTTFELVEIIKNATPVAYHHKKTHPATKTFQAIRIAVNDEMGALTEGLRKAYERVSVGGKVAVITFHSLEDRIVKRYFRQLSDDEKVKLLTKKPIIASPEEIKENPRSRSAKLRAITKITQTLI